MSTNPSREGSTSRRAVIFGDRTNQQQQQQQQRPIHKPSESRSCSLPPLAAAAAVVAGSGSTKTDAGVRRGRGDEDDHDDSGRAVQRSAVQSTDKSEEGALGLSALESRRIRAEIARFVESDDDIVTGDDDAAQKQEHLISRRETAEAWEAALKSHQQAIHHKLLLQRGSPTAVSSSSAPISAVRAAAQAPVAADRTGVEARRLLDGESRLLLPQNGHGADAGDHDEFLPRRPSPESEARQTQAVLAMALQLEHGAGSTVLPQLPPASAFVADD